jgi:hypothetical protein
VSPISAPDPKLSARSAFNAIHIQERLIHSALPSVARQLAVPQGFSLSTTGVFAILLEHRPHPGSAAIWLFIVGAALGFAIVVRASGAHRSGSALQPASGYQLFNFPRHPGSAAVTRSQTEWLDAHVFVTRPLTATVRSEQILPNGPWFVPSLMRAGFPVGRLGVVFAAGMAW